MNRPMGERIKAGGAFVWRNLDAVFVIVVGVVVGALEVVGHPSPETVNAAILGLLAVTAVILLRIRRRRGELDEVREVASDALSERPYKVVWAKHEYDIRDEKYSTMRVTQQLRFIHNRVSTIAHWSQGNGKIESYDGRWRRSEGNDWMSAEMIHTMPIDGGSGEKVIYSFEEENSRGDILEWQVERHAVDRFPSAHEKVSLEPAAKSDHPRVMRVRWPENRPPKSVELRYRGKPGPSISTKKKAGRVEVVEKIPQLEVGESVEIRWSW